MNGGPATNPTGPASSNPPTPISTPALATVKLLAILFALCLINTRQLTSIETVKHIEHRQCVSVIVEESAAAKPACHRRLPPKDTDSAMVGRAQDQAVDLIQEFSLTFRALGKRTGLPLILRRAPAVGHFHEDNVFVIFIGHEDQVLAQIQQCAMPPGIVGLADQVVRHAIRVELIEEVLGARFVSTPV